MNDNIEERINLQKALFEIEDANLYNKHELGQLEEFLDSGDGGDGRRKHPFGCLSLLYCTTSYIVQRYLSFRVEQVYEGGKAVEGPAHWV